MCLNASVWGYDARTDVMGLAGAMTTRGDVAGDDIGVSTGGCEHAAHTRSVARLDRTTLQTRLLPIRSPQSTAMASGASKVGSPARRGCPSASASLAAFTSC